MTEARTGGVLRPWTHGTPPTRADDSGKGPGRDAGPLLLQDPEPMYPPKQFAGGSPSAGGVQGGSPSSRTGATSSTSTGATGELPQAARRGKTKRRASRRVCFMMEILGVRKGPSVPKQEPLLPV